MFAYCSNFRYGTKKRTLQGKFYILTLDQDPFEKVKFSLELINNIESITKMMIFLNKGLVIFATPKTGSTAFHKALGSKADILFSQSPKVTHITPKRFDRMIAPYVLPLMNHPVTSITVIREPIDWLGSWYRYRQRPAKLNSLYSTKDISFDTFAESYMADEKPPYANVGRQAQFITGGGNTPLVTQLWRYDAIADLTIFLRVHLGINFTLETINVSPKADLILSDENRAALTSYFAKDYDLYENAIGTD